MAVISAVPTLTISVLVALTKLGLRASAAADGGRKAASHFTAGHTFLSNHPGPAKTMHASFPGLNDDLS